MTPACSELLRGLLVPNPARRATLRQALHHPWLTADLPLDLAIMNMRLQVRSAPAAARHRNPPTPGMRFATVGRSLQCAALDLG